MPRRLPPAALAYAAVLAGGCLAVFVAPWYVAIGAASPAISDSYALGFDNRVAMLGALLTCLALFAIGFPRRGAAEEPLVLDATAPRGERVSPWLVWGALFVTLATALFFAWIAVDTYRYGEKNYFLDRLLYLVAGMAPYRDIEFTYGPLLILLPAWVARALRPLGVSAPTAYCATWIATYAAGVPLLAWCVNRLALTRPRRDALFAAIAVVVVVNETVGMNGLLIRFLAPAAALLAVHGAAWSEGRLRPVRLAVAVALAGVVALALSPEVGIATLAGAAVYIGAIAFRRPEALYAAPALAAGPLLQFALLGSAALRHMAGMAGGALNFPVLPGPPMLITLGAAAVSAALLPRHLGRGRASGAAAFALATAGAVMLMGALGRADWSHAFFYSFTLVLLAGAMLAERDPRAFAGAVAAFAVVFLAAHALTISREYGGAIVTAAADTPAVSDRGLRTLALAIGADPDEALVVRRRANRAQEPDVESFAPYAPLAAPAGFRDHLGLRLAERGWLAPAYYRGVPFTPAQLATHVESLEPARYLVVHEMLGYAATATPSPAARPSLESTPAYLGGGDYLTLMMWPQVFEMRRPVPDLAAGLKTWVRERYRPVAKISGYDVFERKE